MLPKCIRGASLTELKRKYSGLSLSLGLLCGFPTAEILAVFNFRQLEYNDPEAKMGTRVFSEGKLGFIADVAMNNYGHYCLISYDDGSMNYDFMNNRIQVLRSSNSSPRRQCTPSISLGRLVRAKVHRILGRRDTAQRAESAAPSKQVKNKKYTFSDFAAGGLLIVQKTEGRGYPRRKPGSHGSRTVAREKYRI